MFIEVGAWKCVDELEEYLTIDEVNRHIAAIRKRSNHERRFLAGLKGINLDDAGESEQDQRREEVRIRAEAKRRGMSEDSFSLSEFGIKVEED